MDWLQLLTHCSTNAKGVLNTLLCMALARVCLKHVHHAQVKPTCSSAV